jgi:hypothetical protein
MAVQQQLVLNEEISLSLAVQQSDMDLTAYDA